MTSIPPGTEVLWTIRKYTFTRYGKNGFELFGSEACEVWNDDGLIVWGRSDCTIPKDVRARVVKTMKVLTGAEE